MVSNLQNEVKELTEHMHQMTLTPSYQTLAPSYQDENHSVRNKINEANYVKDQQRSKTVSGCNTPQINYVHPYSNVFVEEC